MGNRYWRVNIEISNICNLHCSFCPEVVRTKRMMDPRFFSEIAPQVARLTRTVALHLMGDPLVHPKLGEMIDICHAHGLKIFLVTNGVLLREKEAELLLHPAIRQVSFSLHSFYDNYGGKDPGLYLDRIFRFTETAFERRPTLFINYRLWNLGDPLASRNGDILRRVAERFDVQPPSEGQLTGKKNWVLKKYLSLHFDMQFTWPALDLPLIGEQGTCQGLSSHFGILVDGTVVPCCLDKEGAIRLGKLPENPPAEILASDRARRLLGGFRRGELVEDLCRRCQYIERFEPKPFALEPACN